MVRGLDPKLIRVTSAGIAFGATVAVSVWLAWLAGGWLDARWNTQPLWSSLLPLLAIAGTFVEFIRQLRRRS